MAHYTVNGVQIECSDEELAAMVKKIDDFVEDDAKLVVRTIRDEHLKETDWWENPSHTMTSQEAAYRQALRDVPQQEGFPHDITWPVKPD